MKYKFNVVFLEPMMEFLGSLEEKLNDIEKELSSLNGTMKKSIPDQNLIKDLIIKLKEINLKLWDIEDGKRLCELNQDFGDHFVQLARQVYITNDSRAALKMRINIAYNSDMVEEKSYKPY